MTTLELIDNIKDKISSEEYVSICNQLKKEYDIRQNFRNKYNQLKYVSYIIEDELKSNCNEAIQQLLHLKKLNCQLVFDSTKDLQAVDSDDDTDEE